MRFKRSIYVVFALLLVFASVGSLAVPSGFAAPLEKGVTIKAIDENGNDIIPLSAISFEKNDTAMDILETVVKQENIQLGIEEHPDFGKMVVSIGDTTEKNDYYWSFIVNGAAAEVGASTYKVQNGDHILFSLTDQFEPTINVTVSANSGEEDIIKETEVMLMEYATGYDALNQAIVTNNLTLQASVDDEYFTFIENVNDTALDENEFWSISVNDEDLMTGILEYQANSGDRIKLEVKSFELPNENVENDSEQLKDIDKDKLPEISTDIAKEHIKEIANYFKGKVNKLTYGSEWWVWGLANSSEDIPESYLESVKEEVKQVNGEFKNAIDLERIIIAISLLGEDATHIEDYNLIDLLINHPQLEKPMINTAIYALLAIDSQVYEAEESIKENLIQLILDQELDTGGWSFTDNEASADITGMALAALAPYHEDENVQEAINRGIDYLSINQTENGGYHDERNGGYTSESVSQVIIGLSAVGIDPTSEAFTKEGINLLHHLLLYKHDDLGYRHTLEDNNSSEVASSQALLAFAAYDHFVNERGSVYHYSSENQQPVKEPTTDNESSSSQPINYLVIIIAIGVIVGVSFIIYQTSKKRNR